MAARLGRRRGQTVFRKKRKTLRCFPGSPQNLCTALHPDSTPLYARLMLSAERALEATIELGRQRAPLGQERVALSAAAGRVLAESVHSPLDLPAHAVSAMDGYALQWTGSSRPASEIAVVGEARTGHIVPDLKAGTCMRIFTGARIPRGADTVVIQEEVDRQHDRVRLRAQPRQGEHVRQKGADLKAGASVLERGTRLNPFQLSLLASLERSEVLVARRPRVVILCTGDELRAPGSKSFGNQLPESNSVGLAALGERAGAEVCRGPLVPDDRTALKRELIQALKTSDLVVTVGGVSVGDHDEVRPALEELGARIVVQKIALKPGKPTLVAELDERLVLALPGNPTSALVVFALLGFPLIRALLGQPEVLPEWQTARIRSNLHHEPGRVSLLRGRVKGDEVDILSNQSSGASTSIAWANALVRIPDSCAGLVRGERVEVLRWEAL